MKLCLILGDQLSTEISSLQGITAADHILMAEVRSEARYVKHHKKKIAFVFAAMRHFAGQLREAGLTVSYVAYDAPENTGSLLGEVARLCASQPIDEVVVTSPSEYRLWAEVQGWSGTLGLPVTIKGDNRFLSTPEDFATWADGRKQLRMEYFYREMRKRYSILMEPDGPTGGQWNYDSENRKPPKEGLTIPPTYACDPDEITTDVIQLVEHAFADHFGDVAPFGYAVTRAGAVAALDVFIAQRLAQFGDYQDAMLQGEPWMYHSHIALYLNCGLLHPLECIEKAEQAYRQGHVPLNAAEGFIRQILGWREYIRGLYWHEMPGLGQANALDAQRDLPAFYWTAQTKMNCLRQAVLETKQNAYAHHIQRLMVLGNFALLAGISPDQLNEWFLIVYADAYEWVELPNVSGMVLFADGGVVASKPYAASGAYIKKMSNYCDSCSYKVAVKNGPKACPFNYLYWDFMARNQGKLRGKLRGNPRLGFTYRTLDKMNDEKRIAIADDAQHFFKRIEDNEEV